MSCRPTSVSGNLNFDFRAVVWCVEAEVDGVKPPQVKPPQLHVAYPPSARQTQARQWMGAHQRLGTERV